jgi:simple sugar transport system substrate-binding protein
LGALALAVVLSALAGCTAADPPVKFLIGVSQANLSEPWRISMTDEIQRQAGLHPELRIIVADASDSLGKQIGDVEKFEGLGVDLLIISPLESEALTPTVTRVFQSIPVIVLNRSVANYDYTLFIGPDNARIGQEAGRFVARTLQNTGGEVLEVLGRSGSPPTLERAQSFRQEIARNPLIRLQSAVLANWLRDGAEDLVLERLKVDAPPRVIFAHNDAMAYGAWMAAEKLGLSRKITFLGVDGLPGPRGGLELLRSGVLDGTFVSPTGGKEAVEFALALLRHQGEQPKKVILGTRFLTRNDLEAAPVPASGLGPRSVAFLPSTGGDGWSQRVRSSAEKALAAGGWSLSVLTGTEPTLPAGLDAVVVDASDSGVDDRRHREAIEASARARNLPLFRLGPQPPAGDDSGWTLALGPDPLEEGRRAGRWLAGEGSRRILELTGPAGSAATRDRSQGLVQGVAERGSGLVTATVATEGTRAAGRAAVAKALAEGLSFDAVFAHTDELTLGAADALKDKTAAAKVAIAGVGAGTDALAALKAGLVGCLIRSPTDLGPLLRSDIVRSLDDRGVSRRLVTSHDVLTR